MLSKQWTGMVLLGLYKPGLSVLHCHMHLPSHKSSADGTAFEHRLNTFLELEIDSEAWGLKEAFSQVAKKCQAASIPLESPDRMSDEACQFFPSIKLPVSSEELWSAFLFSLSLSLSLVTNEIGR